jgi:hypothetical protein
MKKYTLVLLILLCAAFVLFTLHVQAQGPVIPYEQPPGSGPSAMVDSQPVLLAGLTSTPVLAHAGASRVGIVYCYNGSGAVAYIQLFDSATAGAVTVGTTTPKLSLGIPTTLASGTGPAVIGVAFYKGIVAASTTTATGSSTATMDCNVTYN